MNAQLPTYDVTRGMTLRELHARLGDLIAGHNARGWNERNDQPVVFTIQQALTPAGRRRVSINIPVGGACLGSLGVRQDGVNVWTTELTAGPAGVPPTIATNG